MNLTLEAWGEVELSTFQASWIIAGYFDQSHFPSDPKSNVKSIGSVEAAKRILDPTGLLDGTSLLGTPQH